MMQARGPHYSERKRSVMTKQCTQFDVKALVLTLTPCTPTLKSNNLAAALRPRVIHVEYSRTLTAFSAVACQDRLNNWASHSRHSTPVRARMATALPLRHLIVVAVDCQQGVPSAHGRGAPSPAGSCAAARMTQKARPRPKKPTAAVLA